MARLQRQLPGPALNHDPQAGGHACLKTLCLATLLVLAGCAPSSGEDDAGLVAARGTGFDFYVLSLSWSPSHCEAEGAQANRRQCGPGRDLAFIVHGLWPQFERGYPEFCASGEPGRVPEELIATALDIMPSAGLIGHQWRKHGSCTGLSQREYLEAAREAYGRVAIPRSFSTAGAAREANPGDVERAFIEVNQTLPADGIAVTCAQGRLAEVRICLSKELEFRSCPEVDARACRSPSVSLPAAP